MTIRPTSMTQEQIDQYLVEPRNVVMATVRKDGSAQLSAVWFVYRDGKIYTSLYNSSAKYFNIRRDPRVTVCVNAAHPDARSVTVYGTAELLDHDNEIYAQIDRELALCYHDTVEQAEAYMTEAHAGQSSVVVITPVKIIGQDYN
jgi:PPOX class probable F420-dependent enzyme